MTNNQTLENQIDAVTTENWDLKDKIKNLNEQLSSLNLKYNQVLTQLEGSNSNITRLQNFIQNEEWKTHRNFKSAEDEIKRTDADLQYSKKTLKETLVKLEESKKSENHLAQKTIILYNENQELNTKISELSKELSTLKKTFQSKEDNTNNNSPQITPQENLEEYRQFFINLKHEIFCLSILNPITRTYKSYKLFENLFRFFKTKNIPDSYEKLPK
jgi:chromosome segregation ATPase